MKLRVLLITARTDIGGGPKSVLMLSKYLCNTFDIYIASPLDPPYYPLYKENEKVKDHYFHKAKKEGFFQGDSLRAIDIANRGKYTNSSRHSSDASEEA